ncbi:Uncharacterized protein FVE85_0203 [Porphyridium purpureum]|uniref:Uncharacterized protein n=1 Tax=Porphyridium purpureum TaxID=35688 RepID=A0A5J4Z0G1_PORPP|nr:Uncharacterized protein FVE85_0203 [Porphyridium purpureum]|eukprot:POR2602..scf208_2
MRAYMYVRPALAMCGRRALSNTSSASCSAVPSTLVHAALSVLNTPDPAAKAQLSQMHARQWLSGQITAIRPDDSETKLQPPDEPARGECPPIVSSGDMPRVKDLAKAQHMLFYMHSIAHVELSAINLSWDTVARYACLAPQLPREFFADFIRVADDESRHFLMLSSRLRELGSFYGAFPAHALIVQTLQNSCGHDWQALLRRLVLGQLSQEARGLDAGPRLANRLQGAGDNVSANIVAQIAHEEIEHVRIGLDWFLFCCAQLQIQDPMLEFQETAISLSNPGAFSPPFNHERRMLAGLQPEWYEPVAEALQQRLAALPPLRNHQLKQPQKP